MKYLITLALMVFAPTSFSWASHDFKNVSIMPSETYFEFTEPVRPGKGWLALIQKENSWELVPAKVQSKRVVVRNLGEVEDMKLTSDQPEALFLLRHKSLKAGKVATVANFEKVNFIAPMHQVSIPWHGKPLQLVQTGRQIFLISGARKTRLGQIDKDNDDENYSSLLWLGDVDRDGQIDLVIEFKAYDYSNVCLYLSSAAKQGQLVGMVSCWHSGG